MTESEKPGLLERRFELAARGSDLRTEILAGVTTFLTMAMIPFSIANGRAFGITAYALLKLLRGRIGRTDLLLLVLSALFVARFVWLSAG